MVNHNSQMQTLLVYSVDLLDKRQQMHDPEWLQVVQLPNVPIQHMTQAKSNKSCLCPNYVKLLRHEDLREA